MSHYEHDRLPLFPSDNEGEGHDWLENAWRALPDRSVIITARRLEGETLDCIAKTFDLTRERIRQLQQKAEASLAGAQRRWAPLLPQQLDELLAENAAVPEHVLAELLPTSVPIARQVLFRQLGASHPRVWAEEMSGYWTRRPMALGALAKKLATFAPMSDGEADTVARELGFPDYLSIPVLLGHPGSRLTHHSLGWIRGGRAGRDLAYLWLRDQGEPRPISDVASITGTSEHSIRETMRRDEDFAQVRPEGTWALADWRLPGTDNRYRNAVDVVVDVLRELGPLNYEELRAESQRRYPVSSWRINQCLSSTAIGLDGQGRYDLAERGATPVEDPEPSRPSSVQVRGQVVGVELNVDGEMLRGSGIIVHRWLTWYLGLRNAPSTRYFDIIDQPGTLTVRRASSMSQLSSLRAIALNMELVDGCKMAVLLRLDTETATIVHTCGIEACPAK